MATHRRHGDSSNTSNGSCATVMVGCVAAAHPTHATTKHATNKQTRSRLQQLVQHATQQADHPTHTRTHIHSVGVCMNTKVGCSCTFTSTSPRVLHASRHALDCNHQAVLHSCPKGVLVVRSGVTRQQLQDLWIPGGVGGVGACATRGIKLAQVVQRLDLRVFVLVNRGWLYVHATGETEGRRGRRT